LPPGQNDSTCQLSAKGRGSLHFQTSYPRERFEEKNYMQIPQGMLRYAAPPSCGSKHRAAPAAGARNDEADVIAKHKAIPKRHGAALQVRREIVSLRY
jgi:hypothetical protein